MVKKFHSKQLHACSLIQLLQQFYFPLATAVMSTCHIEGQTLTANSLSFLCLQKIAYLCAILPSLFVSLHMYCIELRRMGQNQAQGNFRIMWMDLKSWALGLNCVWTGTYRPFNAVKSALSFSLCLPSLHCFETLHSHPEWKYQVAQTNFYHVSRFSATNLS